MPEPSGSSTTSLATPSAAASSSRSASENGGTVVDVLVVDGATGGAWDVAGSAVDWVVVEAGPEASSSSEHATATVARPMQSPTAARGAYRPAGDLRVSTPGA